MEQIRISSKGQIAIPKAVREALNLTEGAKLMLELRGQEIVLSKEPVWKKLRGAAVGKDLIKAIKAKYAISMLVDQKMNDGIKVPFFGRPAMTAHAIARLALQFGYPIVPCQIVRTKGSYFRVIIHPPIDIQKTNNTDTDCYNIMLKINRILEGWIKENPSQWLWFHNRWGR